MRKSTLSALITAALLSTAAVGNANAFNLNTANSSISGNILGLTGWTLNGTNNLSDQTWWFNSSNLGNPSDPNLNSPLNYELAYPGTAGATYSETASSASSSTSSYGNVTGFDIGITYSLADIGSNGSTLTEGVSITNNSGSTASFTLFQFTDFDLGGYAPYDSLANDVGNGTNSFNYGENDTVSLVGGGVTQTDGNVTASETSTLAPSFISIGQYSALDNDLFDGVLAANGATFTGDAAWIFAYEFTNIAAGDTIQFSKTVSAVPVPAAVWLFGSGLLGLVGIARRRA